MPVGAVGEVEGAGPARVLSAFRVGGLEGPADGPAGWGCGAHSPPQACSSTLREGPAQWLICQLKTGDRPRCARGPLPPACQLPGRRVCVQPRGGLGMMSLLLPAKAKPFSGNWLLLLAEQCYVSLMPGPSAEAGDGNQRRKALSPLGHPASACSHSGPLSHPSYNMSPAWSVL